jgi:hypothetical protein
MCQRNNMEMLKPASRLQPLDMLSQVYADILMDFVEGLPTVGVASLSS